MCETSSLLQLHLPNTTYDRQFMLYYDFFFFLNKTCMMKKSKYI